MAKAKKKGKESVVYSWHPDFKIPETLPDVKVVRTDFIINFIAITAAVLLVGYFGYRQLYAWDLSGRITDIEAQIEQRTPQNNRNLKESAQFKRAGNVIDDLGVFYKQSEPPLLLLVEVAETRPEYIALRNIEFSEQSRPISKRKTVSFGRYRFTGVLQGSSAEALDALNTYRMIVEDLEFFKDKIDTIEVPPPRRNPTLDLFEFNIVITLNPAE